MSYCCFPLWLPKRMMMQIFFICRSLKNIVQVKFTSLNSFVVVFISLRFFFVGAEELLIVPTVWYYMEYLDESYVFLGLTMASYSTGTIIFTQFIGVLDVKLQSSSKMILIFGSLLKILGNLLYSIPVNGYFPLFGRFISGLGESTAPVLYGAIAKCSTNENRAKAFLFFDAIYFIGQMFGPAIGSLLTFNVNIFGWQINAGNSPAVVLVIIWCFLLALAMFLPNDLIGVSETDKDMCSDEDETGQSKTVADNIIACPKPIVFSLYYSTFVYVFLYFTLTVYVPLLAVHQLGLNLADVKLIFMDGSLFGFMAFVATYLLVQWISQHNILCFGIVSQVVPIITLFYFALNWNKNIPVYAAYLLVVSLAVTAASAVNFSLIGSLITKLTPVNSASFYQSIMFTVLHVAMILSRVTAGVTFSQTLLLYNCCGLTIAWLIAVVWLCIEYKSLSSAAENEE